MATLPGRFMILGCGATTGPDDIKLADSREAVADARRLGRECSKLDLKFEQALAEEGISNEVDQCPEY